MGGYAALRDGPKYVTNRQATLRISSTERGREKVDVRVTFRRYCGHGPRRVCPESDTIAAVTRQSPTDDSPNSERNEVQLKSHGLE
jgi:hypothetical protein